MAITCVRPTAEIFYGFIFYGFSFTSIALPQIVQHRVCYNKYNATICSRLSYHPDIENDVQAVAASWMSILPLSALVPALFTILMTGPISDVIGKKRAMIVPPTIYLLQSIIFMILSRIEVKFSPGHFLLGYGVAGVFGGSPACSLLAQAYISSVTTRESRTVRMAMLEATMFLGILLSAVSSGLILSHFGFFGGFLTTGIVNFLNLMYVIFLLPNEKDLAPRPELVLKSAQTTEPNSKCKESEQVSIKPSYESINNGEHTKEGERLWQKINPIALLKRISKAIWKNKRRNRIIFTLYLFSFSVFIMMSEIYMGVLFLKHTPFSFGFKDIGYFLALQGSLRSFALIVVPYILQVLLGFKDIQIVIVGFCSVIGYFITIGAVPSVKVLFFAQIIGICAVIHIPVLRSMASKMVEAHQYGAATAALEVVDVATCVLANLLPYQVYSATVSIHSGAAMMLLGTMGIPGLIGAIIFSRVYKEREVLSEEQKRLLSREGVTEL